MCPDTLQNTRLGCPIQVDVFGEHMGYVHDVSLSWQDSPELASYLQGLPTGQLKELVLKLFIPADS